MASVHPGPSAGSSMVFETGSSPGTRGRIASAGGASRPIRADRRIRSDRFSELMCEYSAFSLSISVSWARHGGAAATVQAIAAIRARVLDKADRAERWLI